MLLSLLLNSINRAASIIPTPVNRFEGVVSEFTNFSISLFGYASFIFTSVPVCSSWDLTSSSFLPVSVTLLIFVHFLKFFMLYVILMNISTIFQLMLDFTSAVFNDMNKEYCKKRQRRNMVPLLTSTSQPLTSIQTPPSHFAAYPYPHLLFR